MLVVVGGQARKSGKTSVIEALIRATPEIRWTAIKISGHRHEAGGESEGDTGRYLRAGASRALLLELAPEGIPEAASQIREILSAGENVICESNQIAEFIRPDCYILVAGPAQSHWKASALRSAALADAVVTAGHAPVPQFLLGKPEFRASPPDFASAELARLIRSTWNREREL